MTTQALVAYFLRLGAVGFGGPIALVERMHRELVEERRWFTEQEYREGVALAQLAPGPLAAQLAMYLGWVRGGTLGAALAGFAFVAPSLVMVLALSILYVRFDGIAWLQDAFYGVGAAVIAVIARSTVKLARTTPGTDRLLWSLFAVNAAVTVWTESERISVIAASGILVAIFRARLRPREIAGAVTVLVPPWLVGGVPAVASAAGVTDVFWFFTKAGMLVFGSGLAIVPFLYGGVVERFGWLTERQFLDSVAVSMLTPGPVVITVAFIGYLVAGVTGGLAAAAGVFLPAYLVVVLTASHFHRLARSGRTRAFVDGVTAAVTGALAGAVVVLGRRAVVDLPTAALSAGSLVLLVRWRRASEPLLL
ncbi:MAG: chromate transporter, partial [Gemmatimonadota bacterium]|nr:chromate transporter [Gemmatimonadota bacterium]